MVVCLFLLQVLSSRSDLAPVNLWSSLSEGVLPTVSFPQIRLSPFNCDLYYLYSRHVQIAVYEAQSDSNGDMAGKTQAAAASGVVFSRVPVCHCADQFS